MLDSLKTNFLNPSSFWPLRKRQPLELSRYAYEPVLGTTLDLVIWSAEEVNETILQRVLEEIKRLEKIYSCFDTKSELNTWLASPEASYHVSYELSLLMEKALDWVAKTHGVFHPGVQALITLWQSAEQQNELPERSELDDCVTKLQLEFCHLDSSSRMLSKLSSLKLNFNALAKGLIVDFAAQIALDQAKVEAVLLNIGGDLKYISRKSEPKATLIEVETGLARARATLEIANQAVASSGSPYRGFKVKDNWYSHIIDPRTGWPVDTRVSATVIAPDCQTADVLATVFSILKPEESMALANSLEGVGCHLLLSTGEVRSNPFFDQHLC